MEKQSQPPQQSQKPSPSEQTAGLPSVLDRVRTLYNERADSRQFVNFESASVPDTVGSAVDKIKINVGRFAFYYGCFVLGMDLLFVLVKRLMIIPAGLTALAVPLAMGQPVGGYTVSPAHAVLGCIAAQLLLCLLLRSLAVCYAYFFAMNALCLGVVCLHAAVIDPEDKGDPENAI